MSLGAFFGRLEATLLRRHGTVKCFDDEIRAGGGMAGRKDGGLRTVEVSKIIGSVGRAQTLRGDFCYLRGQAMTARFYRVGQAMEEGRALPPLELYKVARAPHAHTGALSEYYVLDGHHRVAMARKLGQEFFDAHVVEYCLAGERPGPGGSQDEAISLLAFANPPATMLEDDRIREGVIPGGDGAHQCSVALP